VSTFFSSGNKRSYDDFKKQISPQTQSLFDYLREYCLSLGSGVIEDVRMHRVVFCKTITFRWFVDMEPQQDGILLRIQKNRKEPNRIIHLKTDERLEKVKNMIKEAFNTIR
jgi:predicted transport protein